jgi:elongation factor G
MGRKGGGAGEHRSFGLVGHRAAGKTTLAEMLLKAGNVVRAPGSVERGTALLDYEAEERSRRVSCWPSFAWLPWEVDGRAIEVELVDTPGGPEHAHTRRLAMSGVDLTVLVVSAADGIERGTDALLHEARNEDRPLLVVLNKLDRPHEDPAVLRRELAERTGRRVVHLTMPFRDDDGTLAGVVDLLGDAVLRYDPEGAGAVSREPVPGTLAGAVRRAREAIYEAAALADDSLLEHYLEFFELPADLAWNGLCAAVSEGAVLPVVHTAAARGIGAHALLDAIVQLAPDPRAWVLPGDVEGDPEFVAQWIATRLDKNDDPVAIFRVWSGEVPRQAKWTNSRTGEQVRIRKLYRVRGPRRSVAHAPAAGCLVATWDPVPGVPGDAFSDGPVVPLRGPAAPPNMAWLHVTADAALDELGDALELLRRFDPSVVCREEELSPGYRMAGTTAAQLQRATELLRKRLGLQVATSPALVPYLEHPVDSVREVHGLHCRVSNGEVAEYGECWIDVRPLPVQVAWKFRGDVDEDMLPKRFVPGIEAGARRALKRGPTAGYPVQGVEVRCARGEYDVLESVPEHFEVAGEIAMTSALAEAGTELFEPWQELLVVAPSAEVGAVLADLAARRARVVGMEVEREETSIQASVPERELNELGLRLQTLTGGRAWFVARPSHYDRLPKSLVGEVVAASPFVERAVASGRRVG